MNANLIYLMTFEDQSVYVGITDNLHRRMLRHKREARNGNQSKLYTTMRTNEYEVEVLADGIQDDELMVLLEKQTIQQFKDSGIVVRNSTCGGERTSGYKHSDESKQLMSKLKKGTGTGSSNAKYRPKEFYATKGTVRGDFKRTCMKQDWNFDDFIEEFHSYHTRKSGEKVKFYKYTYNK